MIWWLLAALVAAIVLVLWLRRPAGPARTRQAGPARRPAGARPPGKPTPPKRRTTPGIGPQPGEIWWADVPYEDGAGHKVRPCLVLRGDSRHREVLKITSQDQSDRNDHVAIPTRTWDPDADHDSYLDLTGPIRVPLAKFEEKAGSLDRGIWTKVRKLHAV